MKKIYRMLTYLVLFTLKINALSPQNSDTNSELIFGISGSFTGHFGFYGNAIKHGIEAYFNRVNASGGIRGKQLKLVALNDNGNAQETEQNIETMIKQGIKLFIGIMGTRGILSVLPLLQENKIALLFPWGSHPSLQSSTLKTIINGPGLLEPQLLKLTDYIANTVKLNNIGIFHADDEFSSAGATFLQGALTKKNIKITDIEEYDRFTLDIHKPTQRLINKSPRLVVSIATGMPTVQMVNQFFTAGSFGTEFLGTEATFIAKDILKHRNIDFKFSAPVPNPQTSTIVLAQNYKTDMAHYFPNDELNVLSFMYYVSATIIGTALQKIEGPINQETIIKTIESFKKIDIQGFPVDFDATNRFIYGKHVWII